eukprot:365625-Chlamydomonas_euryale.AAC.3
MPLWHHPAHAGALATPYLPVKQNRQQQPLSPSTLCHDHAQRGPGMDVRQTPPMPHGAAFECRYMTEFQSHEPEFDYLKSLEIEEKINQARF